MQTELYTLMVKDILFQQSVPFQAKQDLKGEKAFLSDQTRQLNSIPTNKSYRQAFVHRALNLLSSEAAFLNASQTPSFCL